MNIYISAKKITEAAVRWGGDPSTIKKAVVKGNIGFASATDKGSVTLDLMKCPKGFLDVLLDDGSLSDNQRNSVFMVLNGVAADTDMVCTKPQDVHNMIVSLKQTSDFNAEWKLGKYWYPIRLTSVYHAAQQGYPAQCQISAYIKMVDRTHQIGVWVSSTFFKSDDGSEQEMTGKEVLAELGFRFVQQDVVQFKQKCSMAEVQSQKVGSVIASVGDVVMFQKETSMWGYSASESLVVISNGSLNVPKKVVVEPMLEGGNTRENQGSNVTELPLVRLFSLELKKYVYSDVEDVQPYEFDLHAIDNLVLPEEQKSLVSKLFHAKTSEMFGDVLKDKHGGMIILANGGPGTGKTLTAEVFAEMTQRPLYVMEMCELGVNVEKMEENLAKIFRRVTRWGAVLLFDEADVFLAERGEDLQRAVIVGIFLRLMDYYHGLLFLTSNRAEKIDTAFKSRITIQLNYKDHTPETRREVWTKMLAKAGVKCPLDGIPDIAMNGRHIRNMVRLVRVLHGNKVTTEQLREVCNFACI